jgi:hypothetical protein
MCLHYPYFPLLRTKVFLKQKQDFASKIFQKYSFKAQWHWVYVLFPCIDTLNARQTFAIWQ